MGVRDTSLQAYRDIVESGALGETQKAVYEAVYKYGPCTSSELYEFMKGGHQNCQHSNIRARLGELRDSGAIKECAKQKCAITNKLVLTWDSTGDMPVKIKKTTKKERVEKVLDELRTLYSNISTLETDNRAQVVKIADMVRGI